MARLYTILVFALLVLVVPVESAGQNGQLARLSEVHIVVERLSQDAKELGLVDHLGRIEKAVSVLEELGGFTHKNIKHYRLQ